MTAVIEDNDFVDDLPDEVRSHEIFGHYIGLQLKIRLELDLLGIEVLANDFCDDNYWLVFRLEDWDTVQRVLSLVENVQYPSGIDWEVEEDDDEVVLYIPRMDAHLMLKVLQRVTKATVSAVQKAVAIERHEASRNGQHYEDWGKAGPACRHGGE